MAELPAFIGARKRIRLLGAAALAPLLAACGGGGGSSGGGSSGGGSSGGGSTGSGSGGGGSGTLPPPAPTPAITLVAGSATETGAVDGTGADARFNYPIGITIDAAGNLYVADRYNNVIRKITPSGQVSTLAGAMGDANDVDGSGTAARFLAPTAITIDANGNLLVADGLKVRRVTPSGTVSTVAQIVEGNQVDARSSGLFDLGGIATNAAGDIYLTNGIGTRRISAAGTTTMLEGTATQDNVYGTRNFIARGIAVDGTGTPYVFDLQHTLSRASTADKLTTLAGNPTTSGSVDGTGTAASFNSVKALAVDGTGTLYAADGALVRRITTAGVVTTIAGTQGTNELKTGALPGSLAGLGGIVADGKGNLYATSGSAIIKIALP